MMLSKVFCYYTIGFRQRVENDVKQCNKGSRNISLDTSFNRPYTLL